LATFAEHYKKMLHHTSEGSLLCN